MLQCFYPDKYIVSTYQINFDRLYGQGYRGIIFDIDNTLVEHGAPVNDKAEALFKELHYQGFKTCIISNNSEERVKPLADKVNSCYVSKAGKPSPKNYIRAAEIMGMGKDKTFFVGDQIFTDVWGANRAGVESFLVKPIAKHEEIQIVLKRYLERIVMHFFFRKAVKISNYYSVDDN